MLNAYNIENTAKLRAIDNLIDDVNIAFNLERNDIKLLYDSDIISIKVGELRRAMVLIDRLVDIAFKENM